MGKILVYAQCPSCPLPFCPSGMPFHLDDISFNAHHQNALLEMPFWNCPFLEMSFWICPFILMPLIKMPFLKSLFGNALSLKCPFGNALSKMPFIRIFFFKLSCVMHFNLPFIKLTFNKNAFFSLFKLFQILRFQIHKR